ncbi:vesicular integral-membrane protein VIP36 [Cylas formicarius]|uniref:vesicular integral-membrane protein VIP36 n=1 Tax=Cylas formicarius TaxID=197179 RepID=UPI002958554E|nr:vesicular integral-membrane protein VIP36 [Cylas formicarius]
MMIFNDFLFIVPFMLAYSKAEWNTKDFMKREHSLMKPYYGSGIDIPFWKFLGNVIITPNYIRLTPDLQSKRGAIWNSVPVSAFNWEIQIQFSVHGKGKDLFGDGFAFWYTKDRLIEGPVFGSKDNFTGLAIIADTYSNHNGPHNHQHPYISAMVNDGSWQYDHDRDGTHTQIAGCEAKFRNLKHDTYLAIRYENDVLTVSTDIENKKAWKECFKVVKVLLPTDYYIGFSAATGDLSDNHDIISVRFFELDLPENVQANKDKSNIIPSAAFFEPPREHVDDPKPSTLSGIKLFLLMLVVSLVLVASVVLGIIFYQKQQEKGRKRLY